MRPTFEMREYGCAYGVGLKTRNGIAWLFSIRVGSGRLRRFLLQQHTKKYGTF